MRVAFLHTADAHVATFDQIFSDLRADAELAHYVDPRLLERAQKDGLSSIRTDVVSLLKKLSTADAVLCTCSTLGPLADEAAAFSEKIIRIDRPLMRQACADGEKVLVAMCLESTRNATLSLLHACANDANKRIVPIVVICRDAWTFFEAGDLQAYAASIARSIRSKIEEDPDIESIVLAQASMRVAESNLKDNGIPVRSSPEIAARRCLEVARANASSPSKP